MTGEQSGPDFSDLYGDLSGIKSMHKAIEADKKALRKGTSLAEAYRPLGELNEVGTALKETKRATSGVKEFRKRVNACDTGEFTQAVDNATELSKELSGLNTGEFTQAVNNAAELRKNSVVSVRASSPTYPKPSRRQGKFRSLTARRWLLIQFSRRWIQPSHQYRLSRVTSQPLQTQSPLNSLRTIYED